eukprot:9740747-Lingulodinium_polyedra.AAC.1
MRPLRPEEQGGLEVPPVGISSVLALEQLRGVALLQQLQTSPQHFERRELRGVELVVGDGLLHGPAEALVLGDAVVLSREP